MEHNFEAKCAIPGHLGPWLPFEAQGVVPGGMTR